MCNIVNNVGKGWHYTSDYAREYQVNHKYIKDSIFWTYANLGRCLGMYAEDVGKNVFERVAGDLPNFDDNGEPTTNCLWELHVESNMSSIDEHGKV